MQENLMNSFYSHDVIEATPKDFYLWATAHVRLCRSYHDEHDPRILREIETSLIQGDILLNSLKKQLNTPAKPLIPASGINRFNQTKELLNSKEMGNKKSFYPFKAELGTSCNLKSIPLPSRTYLKKKTSSQ